MRQAGRYMAEYRAVREKHSFLELCRNPELATEVTVYARNRLGVDAAILFSDILLIVDCLRLGLSFEKGEGPRIARPLRGAADVEKLPEVDPDELGCVYEAVQGIRRELPADIPLIGFAGAPFTVASYCIEGGPSREFLHTKAMMHTQPESWDRLMGILVRGTKAYLRRQVEAGAQCIQLFDSWVGCLSPHDYKRFVQPYSNQVLESLGDVPTIHFGRGTGFLLEYMSGDVLGVDFATPMEWARKQLGPGRPVQGNLDPAVLLTDRETIRREAERVLREAGPVGHIFNLGHGIVPQTPVDNVIYLVEVVRELSSKNA